MWHWQVPLRIIMLTVVNYNANYFSVHGLVKLEFKPRIFMHISGSFIDPM